MWKLTVVEEDKSTKERTTIETYHKDFDEAYVKAGIKLLDFLYRSDAKFNIKNVIQDGVAETDEFHYSWSIEEET